jgi:hypothetical protein
MAAVQQTVRIRGRALSVREGDIFVLQPDTVWSRMVSLVCGGWGHIVTIVLHQGRLMALSVYPPPCGLVIEPLQRFNSPSVTRLGLVRPRVPRTHTQTALLRVAVARLLQLHARDRRWAYDGPSEFLRSALHLQAATESRYHCAELAARLARAADAWPPGVTVSLPVHEVARRVGDVRRLF